MRQASRSTHAPISSMRPSSSATGMKSNGGISVPSSLGRRISASKPRRRRSNHFEERLVVQFKAVMQHRVANCRFEFGSRMQLGVHLGQEKPDAIATIGFCPVKRQVGTF